MKKKIRDFNSNKVKKNFYRQSNVKNVSENDDVQNAINRNKSKNKKEGRAYLERWNQKDETLHEKIKKLKNINFKDFSKMKCYRCHKNEHYARNCIEFKLNKKSSKKNKVDQYCFDYFNSNF